MATLQDLIKQARESKLSKAIGNVTKQTTRSFERGVNTVSNLGNNLPTTQFVKQQGRQVADNVLTAGQNLGQAAFQVGYNRQQNLPTFQNTGSSIRKGVIPAAQAITFPLAGLNPGTYLAQSGLSGAMSKATGGSFTQGAAQGASGAGLTSAFVRATNPIINKGLSKLPTRLPSQVTNRIAPATGNVIQGIGLDQATGNQTTALSLGLDAVTGLAGGKGQFSNTVGKGIQGKPKMQPQDASAIDAVIDSLRNNKLSPQEKQQAITTLDRLASIYLTKPEIDKLRSSQKSLNAKDLRIARELQKRAGTDYDFGGYQIGLVGKKQPTKGVEAPQINRTQLTGKQLEMTNAEIQNRFPGGEFSKERINILNTMGRDPKFKNEPIRPEIVTDIKDTQDALSGKVNLLDYFRTPDKVLNKIGLGKEAKLIRSQYNKYLDQLPKEIDKVTQWYERVKGNAGAEQRIFRYLDGQKQQLPPEELAVAKEIRAYLNQWANKLGLPQSGRIANYITHIFEKDFIQKEFDPDLAKIIQDRIPGSVYDPFLEKRLGQQGYIEDAFRALDAYVKRATRKVNMDPALKTLQSKENTLDQEAWNYVKNYTDRINLRPTDLDNLLDTAIKQSPVGYKFGQRPVTALSRSIRQMVYRSTLGFNVGSALRNLTQGVNTYAQLGEKYTAVGMMKALRSFASKDGELEQVGVLRNTFIEDRNLSATKKTWENLDKGLFFLFEAAERFNRGAAYYGAKSRALSQGKTQKEAIEAGVEMARKTQFTFGSVDTPVALQSDLIKLATQFQSYNVKQTEFLADMVKNKEFLGIARWIGANVAIMATVGQAMGWDYKQIIPFSNILEGESPVGNTPAFQLAGDAYKLATGGEDKYGNEIDPVETLKKDVSLVVPAGVQIKKTLDGLGAANRGYSETKTGKARFPVSQDIGTKIKTSILGQYSVPEARAYFDKERKPLSENQTAILASLPPEQQSEYYNALIKTRENNAEEEKEIKAIQQGATKVASSTSEKVIQAKLEAGLPVTDQELSTAYLSKALSMPKSNRYQKSQRDSELWSKSGSIMDDESLSEAQKDTLQAKIATELGVSKQDLNTYQVAKQDNDTKTLYAYDQFDTMNTFDERMRFLVNGRKPVNGKILISDGVIDNLVKDGLIPYELGKDIKDIDLDETGQLKKKKSSSRGGSSKKSNAALIKATNDYFESLKKIGASSGKIRATSSPQRINVQGLTFGS